MEFCDGCGNAAWRLTRATPDRPGLCDACVDVALAAAELEFIDFDMPETLPEWLGGDHAA